MKTQTETVTKSQKNKHRTYSRSTYVDSSFSAHSGALYKMFIKTYPEYNYLSYKEIIQTFNELLEYIGETLINSEHGIILEGIGYFGMPSYNKKRILLPKVRFLDDIYINDRDKTDIYTSAFFPHLYKNLDAMAWRFQLDLKWRRRMRDVIIKGHKYTCHAEVFKKIKNNGRTRIFGESY
jgi:hypothetical protein